MSEVFSCVSLPKCVLCKQARLSLSKGLRMDAEIPKSLAIVDPSVPKTSEERAKAVDTQVIVIGLSHKTATVEVRERLAVQEENWQTVGKAIAALPSIKEAAVISTCNRFEIYFVSSDSHKAIREVTDFLSTQRGVPKRELRDSLFMLSGDEAVWHALRVSGGLDSLVIGEGQILSQMKRCYELATGVFSYWCISSVLLL